MFRILVFLLIFFSTLANANNVKDLEKFRIDGIAVDEVADSAEQARELAIDKAQIKAFELLLQRFLLEVEEEKIEKSKIESLVSAIEMKDEKISDKRYRANVSVTFQPEQTQFFISNHFLNQDLKKLSILIIPLYNENGLMKLWNQSNDWLQIWNRSKKSDIVNLKIPDGDLDDIINFKISDLEKMDDLQIKRLKKEYKVDKIAIVEFALTYQELSDTAEQNVYLWQIGEADNKTKIATSQILKTEDPRLFMNQSATQVVENLENGWASYSIVNDFNANKQDFLIHINTLSDWLAVKSRLESLKFINAYQIKAFSTRYAYVVAELKEQPIDLLKDMRDLGLEVTRKKQLIILSIN